MNEYEQCMLCPRKCKINRNNNELGFCKMPSDIYIARAALHFYEEPPISFRNGSGAIFFTGCNLKCIFCQNYKISTLNYGEKVSVTMLSDIFLDLQKKKAENINLVTPTIYMPSIKSAIIMAKERGLNIPIVYNSSGYENVECLKELEGLIDIYLPDFKYYNDATARRYSKCDDYVKITKYAIKEMYRQVPQLVFNDEGKMLKGMIVRHLVLPTYENESKEIIKYLYDTYQDNIYISIMNQYTPLKQVINDPVLKNKVDNYVYDSIVNYACDIGVSKAFIQEGDTASESFIPSFNMEGVK